MSKLIQQLAAETFGRVVRELGMTLEAAAKVVDFCYRAAGTTAIFQGSPISLSHGLPTVYIVDVAKGRSDAQKSTSSGKSGKYRSDQKCLGIRSAVI